MTKALALVKYDTLTEQVAAVEKDGYAYFPGVLQAAEVDHLKKLMTDLEPISTNLDSYKSPENGGDFLNMPTVTWMMLIMFLFFWFCSRYTVMGTNIYAVGGNPKAARSIGINVDKIKIITLMVTSFFSALVGILYVARVSSGNATTGEGMEFDVIAAVVVGGTALGGAVGTMTGTLMGVLFIAMISNGLIHWGVDPDLNKVVKGLIIFLAVVINSNITFKNNSGPKED